MRKTLVPALALSVVASGCGGDDANADRAVPTTTAPATTEAPPTDEEQLEALAQNWHDASNQIYDGEADIALAADFLVGDYLSEYQARFSKFTADGYVGRADPQGRDAIVVESASPEGDMAVVVTCDTDAGKVIVEATGVVVNDEVVAGRYRTDAVRVRDGWRFNRLEALARYEGATECEPA